MWEMMIGFVAAVILVGVVWFKMGKDNEPVGELIDMEQAKRRQREIHDSILDGRRSRTNADRLRELENRNKDDRDHPTVSDRSSTHPKAHPLALS